MKFLYFVWIAKSDSGTKVRTWHVLCSSSLTTRVKINNVEKSCTCSKGYSCGMRPNDWRATVAACAFAFFLFVLATVGWYHVSWTFTWNTSACMYSWNVLGKNKNECYKVPWTRSFSYGAGRARKQAQNMAWPTDDAWPPPSMPTPDASL